MRTDSASPASWVNACTSLDAIALLSPILLAVAGVVFDACVANLWRARVAPQDEPLVLTVVNAVIPLT